MTTTLLAGAVLAFAVGVAHSWLGERYILIRLFRKASLPKLFGGEWFTRQTLRFAWHLTTLAWWGFGALLAAAALTSGLEFRVVALRIIAATFLASALIALAASRGRHLAWIVFLAIALAAGLASR